MLRYTPAEAIDTLNIPDSDLTDALAWLLGSSSGSDDNSEFRASVSAQYRAYSALTEKQWRAVVAASQGKRLKFRRASGKPAPVKSTRNKRRPLTPAARQTVRVAITQSDSYDSAADPVASLTGDNLWDVADKLGIDVDAALGSAADAARAKASAAFDAIKSKAPAIAGGNAAIIDWQRIREIAREEIHLRLNPVIKPVVIVDKGDGTTRQLDADLVHPQFENLVRAVACRDFTGQRLNVLLVGPTGTGKSYACRQVAKLLDLSFFFQSQADESFALVGYERVNGAQKYTPFVTAFRDGGVCLLDELDRYDTKALTALNAALANGEMVLDNGEVIKRHPDFICVGAANTFGMGGSSDFTAAERLDLSTISRFAVRLDWHVDAPTEDAIAAAKASDPAAASAWLQECRAVRAAMSRLGLPYLADQRCVEAGANLLAAGMPVDNVREVTYLASLDSDQRKAVLDLIAAAKMKG